MPEFSVVREPGLIPFGVVDAEGNKLADITAYLRWLVLNGRSPYTVRSYAFGLVHFHSWVLARGGLSEHITPSDIAEYIAAYRSEGPSPGPATTNHRLTVLSGFYRFLIDTHIDNPAWAGKRNPVPIALQSERTKQMHVRQRRARADLRRRVPQPVHRQLDASEIASLFNSARSLRDQALLKLLEWSGQRIGDWSDVNGRHGILGLELGDIDPFRRMITVQLKGSRRSHIIPVGEPFCLSTVSISGPSGPPRITQQRGSASAEGGGNP
jgi:site-specific recombinase XerD